MRKKEDFFAYMTASAYHVISKEVENCIFRQKEFLSTHVCTKNPHWQRSGTIIFCKYFIVILDTLRGSFLDVLFLLLAVILSEFYEKPRRNKDSVIEKSTWKNLCKGHHCFDCTPFFLSVICCFLWLLLPPSQVAYLLNGPYKDT